MELPGRLWPDGSRCFCVQKVLTQKKTFRNVWQSAFPQSQDRGCGPPGFPSLCAEAAVVHPAVRRSVETSPSASGQSAAQLTKRNHCLLGIDVLWALNQRGAYAPIGSSA